jgi:hypothetical protein
MPRKSLLLALILSVFVFAAVPVLTQAATRELIPAGTLLSCTVSEPNFSSKTAQVGDPVLCHLGPVGTFGHSVFPRGAELGGHLEDAKAPGHFVGKGWLQLEFDRMILPGAEVLPLSAKIINTPHMKVDAEGKIHGKGHPVRDAVEWSIPVLWPIKVLTLPERGPYPALKGETRLSLRLMEDIEVGGPVARNFPAPPWASPSSYHEPAYSVFQPATARIEEPPVTMQTISYHPQTAQLPVAVTPAVLAVSQPAVLQTAISQAAAEAPLTVLALVGGEAFLAREYWVQGGDVHCLSADGDHKVFPLEQMDLYQTASLNKQRNIKFVLQSRDGVVQ